MKLILASRSPRRRGLLRNAGFEFAVRASRIEEVPQAGETPARFACRLAREKAHDVARKSAPGTLVLGADTVVTLGGEILGKPTGRSDAERMLRALSGRTHRVMTGVCLIEAPGRELAWTHETTRVTFRTLDEREIREYARSKEPYDKAGAYAIQGRASCFVTRIEGCYSNVVGLPLARVYEILKPYLAPSPG